MKPAYLGLSALLGLAGCHAPEEAAPKPVVEVKVARAETTEVRSSVRAPASIFAREQAGISSRLTAPIRKLLVRKGDTVANGQLLAELENRDLIAQRDEAAAAVTDAEANLQRVTSGTLPTDIERARGQVATAEAALNQAQKIYERRQQLFQQGAIPQRELLVSQTEFATAKTNLEVARKSLDLLENQSRDRDIQMARSRVDQARAHLKAIAAQLDFTEIRSSSSGSITEQFLFPGDMAKPDAPIFTVMDLSVAVARAQIPDSEAGQVRKGQACSFTPADHSEASFAGRVSVVNQAVDPARRTIETWCEIPNPQGALRAGVFGSLAVVTGVTPNSIVVPAAAVQFAEGSKKGTVLVVGDKSIAVKKDVETGQVFDGKVQILSGLEAGAAVIIQGGYALPENTQVRVQGAPAPEEKKP